MRDTIKHIIRPIIPKPWNSPVMEFRYGLWNGVSALFSNSGRQLGEENSRPFILSHHLPAETLSCKYEGSRNGRLINISALRIAMKNFDEALVITNAVKQFHISKVRAVAKNSSPVDPSIGIWDLYIMARASIAMIAYQQRFGNKQARERSVSDALTSQFQFISGVFMIGRDMMDSASPLIMENCSISASDLYSYADNNGIFISFNGMACAGSQKKIMDFLEFCNSGASNIPSAKSNDDNSSATLEAIVQDPQNWYQYALSTVEMDCFVKLEYCSRQEQTHPECADEIQKMRTIYQALSQYCEVLANGALQYKNSVSFEQGILKRQNNILDLLKRPNVATISAKHIEARLGN